MIKKLQNKSITGHLPPPPPPRRPLEIPPYILKEIFDLKEKVGKLEGKIEVLLQIRSK